ncbi:MAG TPA: hypothetical protein VF048_08400 [Gemmatimonadaceae bacterium]
MTNDTMGPDAALLTAMPLVLQRANAEITSVLRTLRDCRSQLEAATTDRLDATRAKLREVTSTTELAATDILDGLDRASSLIDQLDAPPPDGASGAEGPALRGRLRDELFTVTGCLQFQDITSQQLAHASTVLVEMESRLAGVVGLIASSRGDQPAPAPRRETPRDTPALHAADASYVDAASRQSVADSVFAGHAATRQPDHAVPEPAAPGAVRAATARD